MSTRKAFGARLSDEYGVTVEVYPGPVFSPYVVDGVPCRDAVMARKVAKETLEYWETEQMDLDALAAREEEEEALL